jgi:hypothetical protein
VICTSAHIGKSLVPAVGRNVPSAVNQATRSLTGNATSHTRGGEIQQVRAGNALLRIRSGGPAGAIAFAAVAAKITNIVARTLTLLCCLFD